MQTKTPNQIYQLLSEKIANYKRQLEMSENSIISCNWIMVVNTVYTVATDENGKTVLSREPYPTQFSDIAARQIENDCKFSDNKGNILRVKRVEYREWYRNQIKELEEVLSSIE